jgi:ferredoxin
MSYKITQDHDKCIGCGSCVAVCPENWKFGNDGKAVPIKTEIKDLGCNNEAADACPVKIIHIIEK